MSIEVIEEIYHAFRGVTQPTKIVGCTHCCTTDAELRDLEKGVREASTYAVKTLAHDGIYTVGNESDYRYFLPRILHEMYLDIDFFDLCIDALTTRVIKAGYQHWNDVEKDATTNGLKSIFRRHCSELSIIGIEGWLYGIASTGLGVIGLLDVLDEPKHEAIKKELILDYLVHLRSKKGNKVKFSHGYLTSEEYDPIYRWAANYF